MKAKEIFSIPNILSYVRILLIPVFIYIYVNAQTPQDYYLAALIILISGLTDFADGQIARRFNMITELGKALDPVADKLIQAAIVFSLMFRYQGIIFVVILFVVKELFMLVNDLVLMRKGKKLGGAMWYGKVSTAVFYVLTFILIAFPEISVTWANLLMGITGFFLLLSFVLYGRVFMQMHREAAEETNKQ
ncbi:CDP-alcohol phosphatidyltransferase family protein [Eubacterium sp. 1001713B170207_170306_E7]|uniref:CDP-alcohol phosphatidyltransferase family protein n=1 Tax=Eubacterium sp. 1001713B170207_170306_E7 TaxID=2787097 RepID=UPI001896F9DD|nr:CDP-alcohol phosphatidyltransferase family protein [Eubacterium sp. 1001713B170207_170306_E7]